jgi:hypothetical protein
MKTRSTMTDGEKIRTRVMALTATAVLALSLVGATAHADDSGLPDPGFEIVQGRTALVVTDRAADQKELLLLIMAFR